MLKQVCHNASIRLYHNPVFYQILTHRNENEGCPILV